MLEGVTMPDKKHWDTVVQGTKTKIKEIGGRQTTETEIWWNIQRQRKKLDDDTKTDRQKLKYGGSYAPRQTFVAAVLLFFSEELQLLNFCNYIFTNTDAKNTNTLIQNKKQEQ